MIPFFSVIIPLYNREKTIKRAVDSILSQTFQDFEIIIVDDASTDKSPEIVKNIQLADSRIIYLRNEVNKERCTTRNIGIQTAKGRYICFLDSDDYHLPFHLQTFYEKILSLEFPIGLLFTSSFNETENGIRSERVCPLINKMDIFHYLLTYTVNPQRWCVENSIAQKILFDPNITICEDLDFSLRVAAENYPITQIPIPTTIYVAAKDSFTHGDSLKWEKELFYLKRIFEKPGLNKYLSIKDTNRLLSICYYHLARKSNIKSRNSKTIFYAFYSIILYPIGYKKNVFKDLIVLILVSFAWVSWFKKHLKRL
jgi:glycosyltransferase involved in cell wall biosynthesis